MRDWKPVRRGNTYCSPACGGGCRYDVYHKALIESRETAESLGPAWKPRVWENLGWHWGVHAKCGPYWVSIYPAGTGCTDWFHCMIGTAHGTGTPGIYSKKYFKTPHKALRASLRIFMAYCEGTIQALSEAKAVMRQLNT